MATQTEPILLEQIPWSDPLFGEPQKLSAELAAQARQELGRVPSWLVHLARCTWLARAGIATATPKLAHISIDTAALAGLIVSQDNSCRYCYGSHRAFLKLLGYPDQRVRRLEQDLHMADFSPAEKAALDFVRQISRANPRPARSEREALERAGFSKPAVAELAYVAACMCFLNRVSTLLAVPPEAEQAGIAMQLMRPLIAFMIRKKMAHKPVPAPARNDGPFAEVVSALEGSPSAQVLRNVIDDAWTSAGLGPRPKAMVVAVVGRALGCPVAANRAKQMLEPHGLNGADVEELLATLASPKLDPFESRLVVFARETVRYRTDMIQRRMREFSAGLAPEQVLEVVGITSLANAVCRLSILLS